MSIQINGADIIQMQRNLKAYREAVTVTGTISTSTYNIDLSLSNIFDVTLGNNVTFTFTNAPGSNLAISVTIVLRQDGVGNRLATFNNTLYTDGSPPILTTAPNGIDVLSFFTVNGGTSYFGSYVMANLQ